MHLHFTFHCFTKTINILKQSKAVTKGCFAVIQISNQTDGLTDIKINGNVISTFINCHNQTLCLIEISLLILTGQNLIKSWLKLKMQVYYSDLKLRLYSLHIAKWYNLNVEDYFKHRSLRFLKTE